MNKPDTSHDPTADRQLADFTDAVLNGKEVEKSVEDAELAELQDTVRHIQAAVKAARPDQETSARIRKHLLVEWKNSHISRTFFWQQPRLILVAAVAVIALAAASLLLNSGSEQLTGAAANTPSLIPLFLSSLVILGLIIYWLIRRSRRH